MTITTKNSSHNINDFFSENVINNSGDIHMSQYKDANDDYLNNSRDLFNPTKEGDLELLINLEQTKFAQSTVDTDGD
jgi:hypothetical protein